MWWQLYLRDWYAPLCGTHRSINGERGPLIHTVKLAAYFHSALCFLTGSTVNSLLSTTPPLRPAFFLSSILLSNIPPDGALRSCRRRALGRQIKSWILLFFYLLICAQCGALHSACLRGHGLTHRLRLAGGHEGNQRTAVPEALTSEADRATGVQCVCVCACLYICGVAVHTDALFELLIEREFLHPAWEDHTAMKRLIYFFLSRSIFPNSCSAERYVRHVSPATTTTTPITKMADGLLICVSPNVLW